MAEKIFFTIQEIAETLGTPEAQIRAWCDQFDVWIPYTGRGKKKWYPKVAVDILHFIEEAFDRNQSIAEIETALEDHYNFHAPDATENGQRPIQQSDLTAPVIQVLESLQDHQRRIAAAEERKAAAEERKATAIEQEMAFHRELLTTLGELAAALQRVTLAPVFTEVAAPSTALTEDLSPPIAVPEAAIVVSTTPPSATEDLFLTDIDDFPKTPPADPSSMVFELDADDLDTLVEDSSVDPKPADESNGTSSSALRMDLDDLTSLNDPPAVNKKPVGQNSDTSSMILPLNIDDRLDGIDIEPVHPIPEAGTNTLKESDLSDLITPIDKNVPDPGLFKEAAEATRRPAPPTSAKVPEDYKSKIIAVIIAMKEKQNLSIAETVDKLNSKGYRTISGKERWDREAIEQIYHHIDLVRTGREQAEQRKVSI